MDWFLYLKEIDIFFPILYYLHLVRVVNNFHKYVFSFFYNIYYYLYISKLLEIIFKKKAELWFTEKL